MRKRKKKKGIFRLLEIAGSRKNLLIASGALAVLHAILSLVPYVLIFYIIRELTRVPVDFSLTRDYIVQAVIAAIISMVLILQLTAFYMN